MATATVYDDGRSNVFAYNSPALVSGRYAIDVIQIDENGNESPGNVDISQAVLSVPVAPTALAYSSGGYAATIISFTLSQTGTVTLNLYDSGATGNLDMNSPTLVTKTGAPGNYTYTIPAIAAGFTGWRQVVLRTLESGVEDGNLNILQIEYSAGVRVAPRPPPPQVNGARISTSGRTLTVPVLIITRDVKSLGTAATVKLFLFVPGASPNYASPDGSAVVTYPTSGTPDIFLNVSATAGSDGVYYFVCRTQTAGGVQSDNVDVHGEVILSTAAFIDPAIYALGASV